MARVAIFQIMITEAVGVEPTTGHTVPSLDAGTLSGLGYAPTFCIKTLLTGYTSEPHDYDDQHHDERHQPRGAHIGQESHK